MEKSRPLAMPAGALRFGAGSLRSEIAWLEIGPRGTLAAQVVMGGYSLSTMIADGLLHFPPAVVRL